MDASTIARFALACAEGVGDDGGIVKEAKKKILARRAQFLAAAIAGLGADACGKDHAIPPDAAIAEPVTAPTPCLSVPMRPMENVEPVDAGTSARPGDAATGDAAPGPKKPVPR